MSYELHFNVEAKREWDKLDASIREPFKKKLLDRLAEPHVPSARLSGYDGAAYKIKLSALGYRLVYSVQDNALIVLAVGKRERQTVYRHASRRE